MAKATSQMVEELESILTYEIHNFSITKNHEFCGLTQKVIN